MLALRLTISDRPVANLPTAAIELQRALDLLEKTRLVDRFGQKRDGAFLCCTYRIGNRSVCGQYEHRQSRATAIELIQ